MTDLALIPSPIADAEPYSASVDHTPAPVNRWQSTILTDLCQVEDLLDSLEAHGYAHREVVLLENNQFSVRWR